MQGSRQESSKIYSVDQQEEEENLFLRENRLKPASEGSSIQSIHQPADSQPNVSALGAPNAEMMAALKSNGGTIAPKTRLDSLQVMEPWRGVPWVPDPDTSGSFMNKSPDVANNLLRVLKTDTAMLDKYSKSRKRLYEAQSLPSVRQLGCVFPCVALAPALWCVGALCRKIKCSAKETKVLIPRNEIALILTDRGVCGYDAEGKAASIDWGGVEPDSILLLRSQEHPRWTTIDGLLLDDILQIAPSTDVPELNCGVGFGCGVPCAVVPVHREVVGGYCEIVMHSKIRRLKSSTPFATISAQGLDLAEAEEVVKQMRELNLRDQPEQPVFVDYRTSS